MTDEQTRAGMPLEQERFIEAFRLMVRARLLDEKFASLYKSGKIHGGVFLGRGQEALSVSVGVVAQKR